MTDTPQEVAIRNFALWTEHAAKLLHCSYADAAVFMTKFGQFIVLMQDATFQAQLARYNEAVKTTVAAPPSQVTSQGKGVH